MDKDTGLPTLPDAKDAGRRILAIVDPPYGIGQNWKKDINSKFRNHKSSYTNKNIPPPDYFKELFRVSENQIIWGGNYYTDYLKPTNNWIVWDKQVDYEKHNRSECELAWTSFNIPARIIKTTWNGCVVKEKRYGFHPHEKPVRLYRWILENYAQPGDLIIDTHVGSASSLIACEQMGFDYIGWELDADYYDAAIKRMEKGIQGLLKLE